MTITSLLTVIFLVCLGKANTQTLVFDIKSFGAVEGGMDDSREAMLVAWGHACENTGINIVRVPQGTFLLNPVILKGPCKGSVQLEIVGTLRASTDASSLDFQYWISFQYVDNLSITGNGVLDAQGDSAWKYNDCATRAPSYQGLVSDITFMHIGVENTANPILIEQQYCPSRTCDPKEVSLVAIRDVRFRNITGSSSTQVVENLQCSPAVPCSGIVLHDIDLSYNGVEGGATSSFNNVIGSSRGKQNPPSCINSKTNYFDNIWW